MRKIRSTALIVVVRRKVVRDVRSGIVAPWIVRARAVLLIKLLRLRTKHEVDAHSTPVPAERQGFAEDLDAGNHLSAADDCRLLGRDR